MVQLPTTAAIEYVAAVNAWGDFGNPSFPSPFLPSSPFPSPPIPSSFLGSRSPAEIDFGAF